MIGGLTASLLGLIIWFSECLSLKNAAGGDISEYVQPGYGFYIVIILTGVALFKSVSLNTKAKDLLARDYTPPQRSYTQPPPQSGYTATPPPYQSTKPVGAQKSTFCTECGAEASVSDSFCPMYGKALGN